MKRRYKLLIIIIGLICILQLFMNRSYAIQETRLKSLSITPEGTELTPSFSKDIYQYEVTVDNNITCIDINAEPIDSSMKVEITGTQELKEGSNLVKIKVSANNGESSTYLIYVIRKSPSIGEIDIIPNVIEENPNKELQVTGIIIDENSNLFIHPEYNPDIHKYTLKLEGDYTSIPLKVVTNKEGATINITGNENLKDGINKIDIKVSDGIKKLDYEIEVYKNTEYPQAVEASEVKESGNTKIIYFLIILLMIVIIVIYIIVHNKKKNRRRKIK